MTTVHPLRLRMTLWWRTWWRKLRRLPWPQLVEVLRLVGLLGLVTALAEPSLAAEPARALPPAPAVVAAAPAPGDCTAPITSDALARDLAFLASPALDGRAPASDGDRATQGFLAERFRCLGLRGIGEAATGPPRYQQPFALPGAAPGAVTSNLIALLPGSDPDPAIAAQIILVLAHHDHLGAGHLGANDNASGTAALLALAAALPRDQLRRTVAFAALAAEEAGLLGSSFLLAHPPRDLPLDRIVQVVNLDMIGSYSAKKKVHVFGAFRGLPATSALQRLTATAPRTRFALGGHSVRGDHLGFCQLGIPYAFFWTPDPRCYHQRCDTADRIDLPHLTDIARVAAALVEGLATSDEDLAASRRELGCGVPGQKR